ncbi:hypothetical protein CPB84DRAFT_1846448 [Gymnopilus junonius]|uniref:F-box domain-containing protein n=1 Tax=Gymnopilus junonius TaxID=109634 RepID=A0A9P5NPS9_GYMJU|nr:hypothetical protein CPB84DRAFT_1846448 [Gymnopilus junonius]
MKSNDPNACPTYGNIIELETRAVPEAIADFPLDYGPIDQANRVFLHCLPPELIASIFQLCILAGLQESPSDEIDRSRGGGSDYIETKPWTLGCVCRSWKQIAWTSPSVWTVFKFHLNSKPFAQNWAEIMKTWFTRSGQLPLFIRFTNSFSHAEICEAPTKFSPLINLVNRYLDRWYQLELDLPPSLLFLFCANRSIIQTLTVRSYPVHGQEGIIDLNGAAPLDLTLQSTGLTNVQIIWTNLT